MNFIIYEDEKEYITRYRNVIHKMLAPTSLNYKVIEINEYNENSEQKIEKIEEIGDIDKKPIMLEEKSNCLKEKSEAMIIELEKQTDRILKAVFFNMIIVSLIPLIMYVLVIIYNCIFKTEYSISQMQILYFILVFAGVISEL